MPVLPVPIVELPQEPFPAIDRTEIVFFNLGRTDFARTTERHSHPYWQLEVITAGTAYAVVQGTRLVLNENSGVLIPPQIEHRFEYPEGVTGWISFKFNAPLVSEIGSAISIGASPFEPDLLALLCRFAKEKKVSEGHLRHLCEGVLLSLVRYVLHASVPAQLNEQFIAKIRTIVESRRGRPVRLSEVSRTLNLSRGHIANRFRQETGMSIKTYFDRVRSEYLLNMLVYSDLSIKAIAIETEFSDISALSRFVVRHLGMSPRLFREKYRASLIG